MLTIRQQKNGIVELTMRDGCDEHVVLRNGGKTAREGAIWLLRHAHRLLDETEAAIRDVGLLTAREIAAVRDAAIELVPPKEGP